MGSCCCKKKNKEKVESEDLNDGKYHPSAELKNLMEKENVVRMINGDLENNFQFIVQIFFEIEDMAPFFISNKNQR